MKIWSMLMLVAMMLSLCSSCSKDKEDGLDSQPGNTDSSASQEDIYYVNKDRRDGSDEHFFNGEF